ncbi:hypothetical protein [Variovorax rhizosphaerae]|uniref:AB hydrolase-1 domain-containing protein n=1 Tax=Variovorax rhizosphaerae TaxID=1836200 RepID=A0ABU8WK48_9BURK
MLLVHGLGADSDETWGPGAGGDGFLARLIETEPPYALLCVDYPSRLGLPRSAASLLPLSSLSAGFATALRESLLPAFEKLVIVAYCLGGLVARFALADLLNPQGRAAFSPPSVADGGLMLILLDAPEDWPDSPLDGPMSAITRMLQVDAPAMQANAAWWRDRFGPASRIDAYAVLSRDHCWVTPFKPGSTVPQERVLRSSVAHLDLVRPSAGGSHEVCDHVAALLAARLGRRSPALAEVRREA